LITEKLSVGIFILLAGPHYLPGPDTMYLLYPPFVGLAWLETLVLCQWSENFRNDGANHPFSRK